MHTKDLARALRAFAEIADFDRAQELHRLAAFFDHGRNETIASRLKRAGHSTSYPPRLKQTLKAIEAGLRYSGAIKPSGDLAHIQAIFVGRPNGSLEEFLGEISAQQESANTRVRRFQAINLKVADQICLELETAVKTPATFPKQLEQLVSRSPAGTAVWSLVANRFIGNRKIYRDRKSALRAIERHFEDAIFIHDL
jgi:hypothetical protein